MSYAINNDGSGWRAVGSVDDVSEGERFSLEVPAGLNSPARSVDSVVKENRDVLLAAAAYRMGPLQDAIDINAVTEEELALLNQWKQYRVELNRIDQQEGFPHQVVWPLSPDEKVSNGV